MLKDRFFEKVGPGGTSSYADFRFSPQFDACVVRIGDAPPEAIFGDAKTGEIYVYDNSASEPHVHCYDSLDELLANVRPLHVKPVKKKPAKKKPPAKKLPAKQKKSSTKPKPAKKKSKRGLR